MLKDPRGVENKLEVRDRRIKAMTHHLCLRGLSVIDYCSISGTPSAAFHGNELRTIE